MQVPYYTTTATEPQEVPLISDKFKQRKSDDSGYIPIHGCLFTRYIKQVLTKVLKYTNFVTKSLIL
jgi:hypothetical protein